MKKIFLAIIVLTVVLLMFTSCGGENSTIHGTWLEVGSNGNALEFLSDGNFFDYVDYNSDEGTGRQRDSGTWEIRKGNRIVLEDESGEKMVYTYEISDSILTLSIEGFAVAQFIKE